jgi:hypothetical protein
VASFHLVHDSSAPRCVAHLGLDRRQLRQVDGLLFWRMLGTGRGDSIAPGMDLRRRALFAVWREEAALDSFLAAHPLARGWRGTAVAEAYTVRLRQVSGRGCWRGIDPLATLTAGDRSGPVAVLTHARVRARRWLSFAAAGRRLSNQVRGAPGLLAVIGVGEAPLGRLGTFSLWQSSLDADAFADQPQHRATVRRARDEEWYAEELFARFEPYRPEGTWGGQDPLAGLVS